MAICTGGSLMESRLLVGKLFLRQVTFVYGKEAENHDRNVAGVGDGLLQGTEALARGFGYGITGVVTKPITNARQHGFVGFFQGLGKAALGLAMLLISGVLDFVFLTVNGVAISCTGSIELLEREPNFTRRRLPRAIRGSSIIFPYNPQEAEGQRFKSHFENPGKTYSDPSNILWEIK